jgi:hypothetical protein
MKILDFFFRWYIGKKSNNHNAAKIGEEIDGIYCKA